LTPVKRVSWQVNYYVGREQRDVQVGLAFQQCRFRPHFDLVRGFGRRRHGGWFCRQIDERARAIARIKRQELGGLVNPPCRVSGQRPGAHDFTVSDARLKTLVAPLDEIVSYPQAKLELLAQVDLILGIKGRLVTVDPAIEYLPFRSDARTAQ